MDIPLVRGRLDGVAAVLIVLYAVTLTAIVVVASAALEGTPLLVVLLVLGLAWLVHVGLYLYAWSRLRKVPFPLGLHGDGVHDRSPLAEVVVPWEAIRSVSIKPRLLRSPLLHVDVIDATKRDIRWSLRILDISADELRQAFTVQSGGLIHAS